MRRDQFDRVVDAAAFVLNEKRIIVIGSQAILGYLDDPPSEAVVSIEVDILPFDDPTNEKADFVDAMIGELSHIHQEHGIYGQGIARETAVLPTGWESRLVEYRTPARSTSAFCLELHDLVIAKLVANRDKDYRFCRALIDADVVTIDVAIGRLRQTPIAPATRTRIRAWLEAQA